MIKNEQPKPPQAFTTTRWSMVRAAGQKGTPQAKEALAALCATYQRPVYDFIRRKWGESEARDLTQGFFTRLLEKDDMAAANPARGKFRAWLLKAVNSFCLNEWDWNHAGKRGGGAAHFSLDVPEADGEPQQIASPCLSPEQMYERGWALTLLSRALQSLHDEYEAKGELPLFEKLKLCLIGWDDQKHEEMARSLGIAQVNTFNVKLNRCKARFRARLRNEIAQTVSTEAEIDEEIQHLFAVLQAG